MGSLLLFAFLAVMITMGVMIWRKHSREIAEQTAEREHTRAVAMGLLPELARATAAAAIADAAKAQVPVPMPAAPAVAVVRAAPSAPIAMPPPVAAPLAAILPPAEAASTAATPAAAPPAPVQAPDARLLKTIKRNRFARVGLAYFEASGFQVKTQGKDSPIDALLFAGSSRIPMMAVRWSRADNAPADADEVKSFAEASANLKLSRGTFVSQHGVTPDAEELANRRGLVLMDAGQLAVKLEALDTQHHASLTAIALGERK
jgi:hypothetical protein